VAITRKCSGCSLIVATASLSSLGDISAGKGGKPDHVHHDVGNMDNGYKLFMISAFAGGMMALKQSVRSAGKSMLRQDSPA